jgi:predicted nucleic acid-binding protein
MRGLVFDTSVWIEYLKGNPSYFFNCQELLEEGKVCGIALIFAELLQGAKGKREIGVILDLVNSIPLLDEPQLIIEASIISNRLNLINQGVGLIDAVIIHSVKKNDLLLWTLNKKVRKVIGYEFLFNL